MSLDLIGWILMAVGAIGLVWALMATSRRGADETITHREVVHH